MYAWPVSSASSTCSSSTPAAFASSGIVGERSSWTVRSSIRRESRTFSSWRPRGTRTDQPLSRKWRLISPMMFGVAYVVSSTPRLDVEAVDRLDEPDRADLHEILELLAAVRVAAGERAHEREVLLDQLLRAPRRRRPRGSGGAARGRSSRPGRSRRVLRRPAAPSACAPSRPSRPLDLVLARSTVLQETAEADAPRPGSVSSAVSSASGSKRTDRDAERRRRRRRPERSPSRPPRRSSSERSGLERELDVLELPRAGARAARRRPPTTRRTTP